MIDEAVRCTPKVSASDISEHFVIVRQYMGQIIFNKGHRVSALFRPEWMQGYIITDYNALLAVLPAPQKAKRLLLKRHLKVSEPKKLHTSSFIATHVC